MHTNDTTPRVISVNISPDGGIPKLPVDCAVITAEKVAGDGRAHKKHLSPSRAVSLIDREILDQLHAEGFNVYPGALGENLTVEQLALQRLAPGARLRFSGGVEIELTEVRKPCATLNAIHPTLMEAVVGRCGFLARVITEGELRPGETIMLISES